MPCDTGSLAADAACISSEFSDRAQWAALVALYCEEAGSSCDPVELTAEAACLANTVPPGMYLPVLIKLRQEISGNTQTPSELAEDAACIVSDVAPGKLLATLIAALCDVAPLPPPDRVAATDITSDSFIANWFPVAEATAYLLDVSTAADFSSFVPGFENLNVGNVLAYSVTGLTPDTDYYFRVRATDGSQTSENSETGTLTTDLFPMDNLVQWLKADALSQADGSEVTNWVASIGLDATGTPGSVPTFETNVQNGLPAISFPGANQFLQTADYAAPIGQPVAYFVVYRLRAAGVAPGQILFDTAHNDAQRIFLVRTSSGPDTWRPFAGGLGLFDGTSDSSTAWRILYVEYNGVLSKYAFDGAAPAVCGASPGTQPADSLRLGNANDGSNDAQVDIGEILIFNAAIADPAPYFLYLNAKWDVY